MSYQRTIPRYPLSDYIESFWILSGNELFQKQSLQDAKTDLIFTLGSRVTYATSDGGQYTSTKSLLKGPREDSTTCVIQPPFTIIGIRFMPLGFLGFCKIPPKDFAKTPCEADLVLGQGIKEVENRLYECKDFEEMVACLEAWLMSKLLQHPSVEKRTEYLCRRISRSCGTMPIAEVCDNSGGEYKKMQRVFRDTIGISPKAYARIARFEHIHNSIINDDNPDWMDIIVRYQLVDQSHLIKEFKHFTGFPPQEFFSKMDAFV